MRSHATDGFGLWLQRRCGACVLVFEARGLHEQGNLTTAVLPHGICGAPDSSNALFTGSGCALDAMGMTKPAWPT